MPGRDSNHLLTTQPACLHLRFLRVDEDPPLLNMCSRYFYCERAEWNDSSIEMFTCAVVSFLKRGGKNNANFSRKLRSYECILNFANALIVIFETVTDNNNSYFCSNKSLQQAHFSHQRFICKMCDEKSNISRNMMENKCF